MNIIPQEIHNQYIDGTSFKSALGNRGLYEQKRINERFYIGDQWHGAKCGNDRPLVRHNVIKRIGDYKMSQILSEETSVKFSAEGFPTVGETGNNNYSDDVNNMMKSFGDYFTVTSERVSLWSLIEKSLKDSYIGGTGVIYTYWDSTVPTGLFADNNKRMPIMGDIACEVLNIEDVVFGDPYCENVQNQPYIILHSKKNEEDVLREARLNGAGLGTLSLISEEAQNGKISVYTKLWKKHRRDGGFTVFATKVTEKCTVKGEFDTGLRYYPVSVFRWETKNNIAYGESEVTYLIPNQIAINRMITANVWSAMTSGMPIMVVNGDTVTEKITNEPGQIIKVFGSNEDVAGAVKYVSPPTFLKDFSDNIESLINNTLTQSGANEVALGDSKADNATALITLRDSALMPLQNIKKRFYVFLEDLSRIWADFWVTYYGKRRLKLNSKSGSTYIDFDAEKYKGIIISAKIDVNPESSYNQKEGLQTLITLFDKGIINKAQLLKRMPEGIVPDLAELIKEAQEVGENDGI